MTRRRLHHRTRGLTLIELVAAMAIFALVAVMGAQALSGMLRQRDALIPRADRAAELETAISLIRADLAATLPMLFYPPGRATPQSATLGSATRLALSVGGQTGLDLNAAPAQYRIEYRLDPLRGELWRRVWPSLMPAHQGAATPEVRILTGVSDLRLRSFWGGVGWHDGLSPPFLTQPPVNVDGDSTGGAPEVYSSALPHAIELVLELQDLGPLPLLETLQ